ncbi:hypothetical protein [Salinibacterium sp. ZJ450]|uniref:hypothetical protein n=1 Tax=Salinibacterium sp. ZJ450 TaxID=2708338 RepID=UPI001421082B|nr:hypothetical protein [Salinibacterium sp. ZJ450]
MKWISRHRSLVAMGVSGSVLASTIVVTTMLTPGYPGVQALLGDGGVWVVNGSEQAVGRVNTEVGELNSAVRFDTSKLEVVQQGKHVLAIDRSTSAAAVIDPAMSVASEPVRLPTDATVIISTGGPSATVVVLDAESGEAWTVPFEHFDRFDAGQPADIHLGADAVIAPGVGGGFVAAAPATGEVLRFSASERSTREAAPLPKTGRLQVADTAHGWVVLSGDTLITAEQSVPLNLVRGESATLQRSADATSVFLSTPTRLLEVNPPDGAVLTALADVDGRPTAPIWVDGCVHAAWADGTTWKRCGADPTGDRTDVASLGGARNAVFQVNGSRALLNDPATGNAWAVQQESQLIQNWHAALPPKGTESSEQAEPGQQPTVDDPPPAPIAALPQSPTPKHKATPVGGISPVPTPTPTPTPPADPAPPEPAAAGTPIATEINATIDDDHGTAVLAWSPFDGNGSPMLGYYAQNLGLDAAPVQSPCTPTHAPTGGEIQHLGQATTATVTGLTQPGATYRLLVWGYNEVGCTASRIIELIPRPAPGPVTAVDGGMVQLGTRYEYQLAALTPVAALYEVQRLDAAGLPIGDVVGFSGQVVPRALTGGPFGEPYAFQVRACALWTDVAKCGEWTDHTAPEPSIDFTVEGLSYDEMTSTWTWTALPDNGDLLARVSCIDRSGGSVSSTADASACWHDSPVTTENSWVLVRVGVGTVTVYRYEHHPN